MLQQQVLTDKNRKMKLGASVLLLARTRLLSSSPASSRSFVSGRSFKILGVQQIAIGALDKKVLSDFWVGKLGIEKVSEYRSEVCTFD
jgi:lactoylglutathione lyase